MSSVKLNHALGGSTTLEAGNTASAETITLPAGNKTLLATDGDGSQLTGINAATVATTAPSSPSTGDMWFDSTSGTTAMKVWNGGGWDHLSNKFSATGGTESTYTSGGVEYKLHAFTTSGTFTAESSGTVDVLVVAGGGGTDGYHAGGGGAGGLVQGTLSVTAQGYSITIGAGGNGGTASSAGSVGYNSTAFGITATRGGNGLRQGRTADSDNDGGSGGGSSDGNNRAGTGTTGQGYAGGYKSTGGTSSPNGLYYPTSGGGGAGGVGGSDDIEAGGYGGPGLDLSNTYGTTYGDSGWFASGGGGTSIGIAQGSPNQALYGTVSQGGGGVGGYNTDANHGESIRASANGTVNTGGGGGGYLYNSQGGGNGGSGIVIIRYVI